MTTKVLNLVINGWPSIQVYEELMYDLGIIVLNLVINGWPSILERKMKEGFELKGFKPCYKWMTFNTGEFAYGETKQRFRMF